MVVSLFKSKIVEYRFLTSDVLFLSCLRPDNFEFEAGQFISIKMFNSVDGREPAFRWKSYSICSNPSQRESLDFIVKIIPDGFASDAFLKLKIGDELEMRGPMGHFVFNCESVVKEHWFLGAGTGLTPLFSMISEYAAKMPSHKFVLIFGVRHRDNLFFVSEVEKIVSSMDNVSFIPTLSRDEWAGARGRVQVHLPSELGAKDFYLCGLNDLVSETKSFLESRGVEKELIHFERYD